MIRLVAAKVVEGENDHLVPDPARNARPALGQLSLQIRLGAVGVASLVQRWSDADRKGVRGAVVGAFELGETLLAGEGHGRPDRIHGGLGARVGEANVLDAGHPPAEHLGERNLALGGPGEYGPFGDLISRGLDHGRMGVAEDEAGLVVDKIDALVAVGIVYAAPLAPRDIGRKRPVGQDGSGVAARHIVAAFVFRSCDLWLAAV